MQAKPKLTAAEQQRRHEERRGLNINFAVTGKLALSLSGRGSNIARREPELHLSRFARMDGRYLDGDREVASTLSAVLMANENLRDLRTNGDRFMLGYYRIRSDHMIATLWVPPADIAVIVSNPTCWTRIGLHISRPKRGDGDLWGWSIDAGEVWPEDD